LICSFEAARAPAMTVFVSPWTRTTSGRSCIRTYLHASHYLAGLLSVASRAHVQVVLRLGKLKLLEEYPVHLVGVVLARVQNEVVKASTLALPDDGGQLDYLWTGAEDDCDGHG
jgi:hypothetical protein